MRQRDFVPALFLQDLHEPDASSRGGGIVLLQNKRPKFVGLFLLLTYVWISLLILLAGT